MYHRRHRLDLSCAGCHHPATHTHRNIQGRGDRRDGETGALPGFGQRGAAAVQPAAALKTRVRVLFRRQAEDTHTHTHTYTHTQLEREN